VWTVRHVAGYRQDIAALAQSDRTAAARIYALVEEISGDQAALESLTEDHFSDEERSFDVTWLRGAARSRLNLWRLKLFSLQQTDSWINHRIIYAIDGRSQAIWLMAIMPRNENYDEGSPRFRRIRREYEYFSIPLLPY
jgi:hypothetical protein